MLIANYLIANLEVNELNKNLSFGSKVIVNNAYCN